MTIASNPGEASMDPFETARSRMVEEQLRGRDINDERVLGAMRAVPRHLFVPEEHASEAYLDSPLPIAERQTISQPYIVALTAQALAIRRSDRVLEIGTGSGYAAAVLAVLAGEVITVERHPSLALEASERLRNLGYTNVRVVLGDGTLGWADGAPYDAIAVTACGPRVPPALIAQLASHGRLVIPIGTTDGQQRLVLVTRAADGAARQADLGAVRFVPLVGKEGFAGAAISSA